MHYISDTLIPTPTQDSTQDPACVTKMIGDVIVDPRSGRFRVADWGQSPYFIHPDGTILTRGFKILKLSVGIIWVLETTYEECYGRLVMKYRVYCKSDQTLTTTMDLLPLDDASVPWHENPVKAKFVCIREYLQSKGSKKPASNYLQGSAYFPDNREMFGFRNEVVQNELRQRIVSACYTTEEEDDDDELLPDCATSDDEPDNATDDDPQPRPVPDPKFWMSLISQIDSELERCKNATLSGKEVERFGELVSIKTQLEIQYMRFRQ